MKPTLYIDVDDTIMANCYAESGFDLRPGVVTQLRVCSRLFRCVWLTMWDRERVYKLMKLLYGARINQDMLYADWPHNHPQRKAGYVLGMGKPRDFWWIEDPLCDEEIAALTDAGRLDRYIRVEPFGQWGFLDGLNELFKRAGITETDIKKVGGKMEWFDKEFLSSSADVSKATLRDSLSMVKLIAETDTLEAQVKVKEIHTYVTNILSTIYEGQ